MIKPIKNIITLSVATALSLSLVPQAFSASYEVVPVFDLNESASHKYTYAQQRNENGESVISGIYGFNFPVQFIDPVTSAEYLTDADFTAIKALAGAIHDDIRTQISLGIVSDLDDLEDFDALKAGNPTANDLAWTVAYLAQQVKTERYQKRGDTVGLTVIAGQQPKEFVVFDVPFPGTSQLTRSTIDIVGGITNSGITYGAGTAPYLPEEFTEEDGTDVTYWIRQYAQRAFFHSKGDEKATAIPPPATEYGGGISALVDVSEAGIAVGFYSNLINEEYKAAVEDPVTGCDSQNDVPEELCWASYSRNKYHIMAFKEELPSDGIYEDLGLLVNPNEEDTRPHSSYALATNVHGVAVGYADGWDGNDVQTPSVTQRVSSSYAVIYKKDSDGKNVVFDFNQEHAGFNQFVSVSKAYDINDDGLVVGHGLQRINGKSVQKFFYVDTNVSDEEMKMVYPTDFFLGSKSTARSVNRDGQVVGEGEVESHNLSATKPRRTEAFLYNIKEDTFTAVSDLIDCKSEYDVFEARHINDNGDISASAIVQVDRLDAYGQPMVDESGNPLKEDVVRAVTLIPTGGESEDCSLVADKTERQGASTTMVSVLSLFALLGFRRKRAKK